MVRILTLAATILCVIPDAALAGRNRNPIGFTVGIGADPAPNLYSVAMRYNLTDYLQIHLGYGGLSGTAPDGSGGTVSFSTTALGGGARLFVPFFALSPFIGVNYSKWSASGTVSLFGEELNLSSADQTVTYITFGFDFQSIIGLNVGIGGHYLMGPDLLTDQISLLPHLYVGWFF